MYVLDAIGQRVVCPHPLEPFIMADVLGDAKPRERKKRIGFMSHCACRSCAAKLLFDVQRDELICHNCESTNIAEVRQMVGETCPKCGEGKIKCIDTGMIS